MGNFLFADGHVKAMLPLATLAAADGGTANVNMWTRDNKNFTDFGDTADATQAKVNLTDAQNLAYVAPGTVH
jgi:prepilin-type processing-associated H-X9-DG protein